MTAADAAAARREHRQGPPRESRNITVLRAESPTDIAESCNPSILARFEAETAEYVAFCAPDTITVEI